MTKHLKTLIAVNGAVHLLTLRTHRRLANHRRRHLCEQSGCGVSSTGIGEFWIRYTVAHDICARVQYRGTLIQAAADDIVQRELKPIGGEKA